MWIKGTEEDRKNSVPTRDSLISIELTNKNEKRNKVKLGREKDRSHTIGGEREEPVATPSRLPEVESLRSRPWPEKWEQPGAAAATAGAGAVVVAAGEACFSPQAKHLFLLLWCMRAKVPSFQWRGTLDSLTTLLVPSFLETPPPHQLEKMPLPLNTFSHFRISSSTVETIFCHVSAIHVRLFRPPHLPLGPNPRTPIRSMVQVQGLVGSIFGLTHSHISVCISPLSPAAAPLLVLAHPPHDRLAWSGPPSLDTVRFPPSTVLDIC